MTAIGRLAGCGLALGLAACATTNTPAQTLAYERWSTCAVPYVQLERISVDGRITFQFSSSADRHQVVQCLAEVGRTGSPLPDPVAVRPPGGP